MADKKLKNVIKGHLAYEEIERLTIIDINELSPIYAGTIENWFKPLDSMKEYKKEIENRSVVKSEVNCGCQLFVFV